MIPRELQKQKITLPDPQKIRPLKERIVKCFQIVQPAVAEHHAHAVTPVTGVSVKEQIVCDPASRRDRSPKPAQLGLRRVTAARYGSQAVSTSDPDVTESHLPRIVGENHAYGSDTRAEQGGPAQTVLIGLRPGRTDVDMIRGFAQRHNVRKLQCVARAVAKCNGTLPTAPELTVDLERSSKTRRGRPANAVSFPARGTGERT